MAWTLTDIIAIIFIKKVYYYYIYKYHKLYCYYIYKKNENNVITIFIKNYVTMTFIKIKNQSWYMARCHFMKLYYLFSNCESYKNLFWIILL